MEATEEMIRRSEEAAKVEEITEQVIFLAYSFLHHILDELGKIEQVFFILSITFSL